MICKSNIYKLILLLITEVLKYFIEVVPSGQAVLSLLLITSLN